MRYVGNRGVGEAKAIHVGEMNRWRQYQERDASPHGIVLGRIRTGIKV